MTIAGKAYPLDPYCSVVIREIGDISCDVISPAQQAPVYNSNPGSSTNILAYSIGGIILIILVILGVVIVVIVIWKRSKKAVYNIRYAVHILKSGL